MSSEVQLSGKEMLNKKVLSSRRKVRNDEAVRRDTGRVFHAHATPVIQTQCFYFWRFTNLFIHLLTECKLHHQINGTINSNS